MPMPPITHYKDEPVDESTNDIVNRELDKEASSSTSQDVEKKVELEVLPVKNREKKGNASNIVNAFRQKMLSTASTIELPSVGKSVEFKQISGADQKELSKTALENESRSDIMYCAMLSLINRLSLDKDFDIRNYTEFERIAITLNLQQMNKINPEIRYTCVKCDRENSYKMDIQKLLRAFGKTYRPDKEFSVSVGGKLFSFVAGWPNVGCVEEFFKHYFKKYDNSSKRAKESISNMSQVEYIGMFIKKVTVTEENDKDDSMTAVLEELPYAERVQIIDCLPQGIIFDEETGVLSKIIENFIKPVNECFKYRDCAYCGAEQEGAVANITDFLGG